MLLFHCVEGGRRDRQELSCQQQNMTFVAKLSTFYGIPSVLPFLLANFHYVKH
ncbi:MAG: hypothetical protein HN353_04880 [Bdellovibrionales bacterium]|jgi:hypothetical protein|nr:hypothetical protein [Bdellovibrionales bacterium]MBT3527379.1 hypothetical protein [Bdellovibrionales bacterium]MBT7669991.1 hypothetical protein [Bdellovibrionales bacterium]MBT7766369.1 hypothetical protein [Bdellovibrionales bacterium]